MDLIQQPIQDFTTNQSFQELNIRLDSVYSESLDSFVENPLILYLSPLENDGQKRTEIFDQLARQNEASLGRFTENGKFAQFMISKDNTISRLNSRIIFDSGAFQIRDEGSANGTFYRLQAPIPVEQNLTFHIASYIFEIENIECVTKDSNLIKVHVNFQNSVAEQSQFQTSVLEFDTLKELSVVSHFIGSHPILNSITLNKEKGISEVHSEIFLRSGQIFIRDKSSDSGTWIKLLNDYDEKLKKLLPSQYIRIFDGMSLRLGLHAQFHCSIAFQNLQTQKVQPQFLCCQYCYSEAPTDFDDFTLSQICQQCSSIFS